MTSKLFSWVAIVERFHYSNKKALALLSLGSISAAFSICVIKECSFPEQQLVIEPIPFWVLKKVDPLASWTW